jgi:hypothetical protein
MQTWTPAAVQAWSALATAVIAGIGVPFLLWDRFWPRPHQVLATARWNAGTRGLEWLNLSVASAVGEPMVLLRIQASRWVAIQLTPESNIAMGLTKPDEVRWARVIEVQKSLPQGHQLDALSFRLFFRDSRPDWLRRSVLGALTSPRLTLVGMLPYRPRRGFRLKVGVWSIR